MGTFIAWIHFKQEYKHTKTRYTKNACILYGLCSMYSYFIGIEHVVATGPDTFAITNYPNAATAIHCGNIQKKTLNRVMTLTATIPSKIVSS